MYNDSFNVLPIDTSVQCRNLEINIQSSNQRMTTLPTGPSSNMKEKQNECKNIVSHYVAGLSENLCRCFFSKPNISVHYKPNRTLRQKLVRPKNKTPKHKLSKVVYAVQSSEENSDVSIGEKTSPLTQGSIQDSQLFRTQLCIYTSKTRTLV